MKKLNYVSGKAPLLLLAKNPVIISVVKIILAIMALLDRVMSHLKLRAVLPNCSDCLAHWTIRVISGENVSIGKSVGIGRNVVIAAGAEVTIGDGVRISDDVIIQTAGLTLDGEPPYTGHSYSPILIEDGVWLGARSMVLGGVTIGAHSLIGAGTIVTKDVEAYSVVVGAPSRVVKSRKWT